MIQIESSSTLPASVRLQVSDRTDYLMDELGQHSFCEIVAQTLTAYNGTADASPQRSSSALLCREGSGVRPCWVFAEESGINIIPSTSQANSYICI